MTAIEPTRAETDEGLEPVKAPLAAAPARPRKPPVRYARKQYWNEPTLTLWEKAYLPEVLRGMAITTGVFLRNMAKWLTGRKGAVTTYYPEEKRADFALRDGVPGKGDRDRIGFRPERSGAPQVSGTLRDRLFALRVLRPVRGGVP